MPAPLTMEQRLSLPVNDVKVDIGFDAAGMMATVVGTSAAALDRRCRMRGGIVLNIFMLLGQDAIAFDIFALLGQEASSIAGRSGN